MGGKKPEGKESVLRKHRYQQDRKERGFYKNLVDEPVRKESFPRNNLNGERKDFRNRYSFEQENKQHFFHKKSHQEDRKERFFFKSSEHNHLKPDEFKPP